MLNTTIKLKHKQRNVNERERVGENDCKILKIIALKKNTPLHWFSFKTPFSEINISKFESA